MRVAHVIIGAVISAAVFIRFTHETAHEAKALSLTNRDELLDVRSHLADEVADRMLLINNDTMARIDDKLDKINERLRLIELRVRD